MHLLQSHSSSSSSVSMQHSSDMGKAGCCGGVSDVLGCTYVRQSTLPLPVEQVYDIQNSHKLFDVRSS